MRNELKKVLAGILALSMIMGGIYYVAPEASEVQAETAEESAEQIVYSTEEYTGETDVSEVQESLTNKTAVVAREEGHDGWLFAGWFTDEYCTTPVKSVSDDITTYHAKFVDPGVLTVKLQVKSDVEEEGVTSTNLRLVTSVDSLDYTNVGFEVYYGDTLGKETPSANIPIQKVYKRIVASSTSGVDYNYSPKVVDTDSEYFATATLIGIGQDNYNVGFHIKPYWTTLNGVKVYGTSRYVTIEDDALSSATTVNVPVEIAAAESYTVTDASDTTNTAITTTEAYHDGTYAHLRIAKTAVASSLTKLSVSNGTNTATAYYRNLKTVYAPSSTTYDATAADKTWYTVCDSTETEYVIATTADLYALPDIVNTDGETFSEKTIYVIADIIANKGTASVSDNWTAATTDGTSYAWSPIGNSTNKFQGVFDGSGHTIEGIVASGVIAYCGLFGYTKDAEIQNVSLINSLFKTTQNSTTTAVYAGSVVAYGEANLTNIYSSAIVNSGYMQFGGLIGVVTDGSTKADSNCKISNCWYAGEIYSRYSSSGANLRIGGLVGYVLRGTVDVETSLFTGDITFKTGTPGGNYIGGLVADSNGSSLVSVGIKDSLSAGTITLAEDATYNYVGSVVGRSNKCLVTIDNVYATTDCYSATNGVTTSHYLTTDATQVTEASLIGLGAYHVTNLDFVNDWTAIESTLPVPTPLADDGYIITEGETKADTSWYTAEEGKTEYEIANASALYGLAILVNDGNTFEGITLKLTNNINLNQEWDASITFNDEGGPIAPSEPVNEWIPIGTSTNMFKGTFEGNGKVISGLYIDKLVSDGNGTGLFGNTENVDDSSQMCTIRNFALNNSFMYVNASNNVGGIVGIGEACISNVYTDVEIYGVNNINIGGIIGNIGAGQKTTYNVLDTCWYDGMIVYRSGNNAYPQAGGLVGYISAGPSNSATYEVKNEINHCLFTGTINYKYVGKSDTVDVRIGGLVGRNNGVNSCTTFADSLSAGMIELYWGGTAYETGTITRVGSVMGRDSSTDGAALNIAENSVYATSEFNPVYNNNNVEVTTNVVVRDIWDSDVTGLDKVYWQLDSTATIPVLKNLVGYTNNKWAVLP